MAAGPVHFHRTGPSRGGGGRRAARAEIAEHTTSPHKRLPHDPRASAFSALARAQRLEPQHGVLRFAARPLDIKTAGHAWRVDAEGEQRAGSKLEPLVKRGWKVLHGIEFGVVWPDTKLVRHRLSELAQTPVRALSAPAAQEYRTRFSDGRARSAQLAHQARELVPGGSHHSLAINDPFALHFDRAEGAYRWDVDGNRYVDFIQAAGANILGPGEQRVREKVQEVIGQCGGAIGMPHPYELKLAALVREFMPGIERFRMTASGTEAAMAAMRVARAFTEKVNIIKMGGAYHGWSDQLMFALRQPGAGRQGVNGIPEETLSHIGEAIPNDIDGLRAVIAANASAGGTAAVIVEPLGPQSGTLPVDIGFHADVLASCRE